MAARQSLATTRTEAPWSGSSCRSSRIDEGDDEGPHIVVKRSSHHPRRMLACENSTGGRHAMNTRKVATAVVAALALAGAGVGTAVAASHGPARVHQGSSESTGPDTDNLQVGDQTSPDPSAAG